MTSADRKNKQIIIDPHIPEGAYQCVSSFGLLSVQLSLSVGIVMWFS